MIYQHPLAYLMGMEGLALLRSWAGDFDRDFVAARFAEIRRLLDDEALVGHEGVLIEEGATAAAYRQWSARYDDPGNGLFDLDAPIVAEIADALPVGTVLDAACGTGRLTARLVERGNRVIGVDGSAEMVQQAQRKVPGATFAVGDLHRLPVAASSVDLVLNGLALTHVDDLGPVLAEFARVLTPGGHLVISDVHPELVVRGSVVKAVGPEGQPQLAATFAHSVGDLLRAGLAAGFTVRRFHEDPPVAPADQPPLEEPAPDAVPGIGDREIGTWDQWPWTLLDLVPEASRAAWNKPSILVWHFQLS